MMFGLLKNNDAFFQQLDHAVIAIENSIAGPLFEFCMMIRIITLLRDYLTSPKLMA